MGSPRGRLEVPHRKVEHVAAAARAVVGRDEVVADREREGEQAARLDVVRSPANVPISDADTPSAGCRRGAGGRRRPRRGATSHGSRGRSGAGSLENVSIPARRTLSRGSPPSRSTRSSTSSVLALPRAEHLVEQRAAVLEVPVEPAAGTPSAFASGSVRTASAPARRRGHAGPPRSSCSGVRVGAASRPVSRPARIDKARGSAGTLIRYRTVRMQTTPMRLPPSAHTSRPWRIHALAAGFRLEDVWALPTPGGPDDLPRLVDLLASGGGTRSSSRTARALWALRWQLGRLLGWDRADAGLGARVPTLRDRLPDDRATPRAARPSPPSPRST